MGFYGKLESGWLKCPLRTLNNEEMDLHKLRHSIREARINGFFSKEDLDRLEKSITESEEDIKKCREGYNFERCEGCTNGYYLTGYSCESCINPPSLIAKKEKEGVT